MNYMLTIHLDEGDVRFPFWRNERHRGNESCGSLWSVPVQFISDAMTLFPNLVLERFFSRSERQQLFRSWAGSASLWVKVLLLLGTTITCLTFITAREGTQYGVTTHGHQMTNPVPPIPMAHSSLFAEERFLETTLALRSNQRI